MHQLPRAYAQSVYWPNTHLLIPQKVTFHYSRGVKLNLSSSYSAALHRSTSNLRASQSRSIASAITQADIQYDIMYCWAAPFHKPTATTTKVDIQYDTMYCWATPFHNRLYELQAITQVVR